MRTVYELLGSSAALFLPGMYFGNMILVCMGLVPLFFAFVGLAVTQPRGIEVRRATGKEGVLVGEVVESRVDIEVRGGVGPVVVADELPEEFELVSGSNFKVVWKWLKPKKEQIAYSAKCTKRGIYGLAGVRWESRHPLWLRQAESGVCAGRRLVVRPRLFDVRKVRSVAAASKIPFPSAAVTKVGPVTMDFRELRQYSHGDPFKFINWKATARTFRRGRHLPAVNDYEREGMKIVWIFLDRSSTMTVGPSVASVFEHAAAAVNGLAYYYLRRGCRVGLCSYDGGVAVLYPDAGNRQYHRILQEVLRMKPEVPAVGSPGHLEALFKEGQQAVACEENLRQTLRLTRAWKGLGKDPRGKFREELKDLWEEEYRDKFPATADLLARPRAELEGELIVIRGEFEFKFPTLASMLKEFGGRLVATRAGLKEAVRACRGYVAGSRPLFVVVTRFERENAGPLLEGIKKMARLARTAGPRLPVMVVNVSGYGLAARTEDEKTAGGVLWAECVLASKRFRARVAWVDWDPTRAGFTSALLAQVAKA
jgi:uncharacterized protein (DUF58 family)